MKQYKAYVQEALFGIFVASVLTVVLFIPSLSSDIFLELIISVVGITVFSFTRALKAYLQSSNRAEKIGSLIILEIAILPICLIVMVPASLVLGVLLNF